MKKTVYFDNNATTQVAEAVLEEMMPYYTELYGNPSSMHVFGGQIKAKIREARDKVAALLGVLPEEIIFTSCGTESDNAAILGTLESCPEKRHIVTTRVEHPAVGTLCRFLKGKGYRVTELSVDRKGRLDLEELSASLNNDTALVSVMYANNETGVIFPVEEIGAIVKAQGVALHTDAVQAVGKIPLDLSRSSIDMLSLSGHKLHAPKGIGALFIRKGTRFSPLLRGGHQEKGRRGGTENVPYIIGLGKAAELAQGHLEQENDRVRKLRDRLEAGLVKRVSNTLINGDTEHRLPNTCSISFEYVEGESILMMLNELGICASSGSACTSGSLEPSHVLRAMGVPFTAVHGSIRFSLSIYTQVEEIDYVLEHLPPIIERLRELSPFGKDFEPRQPS